MQKTIFLFFSLFIVTSVFPADSLFNRRLEDLEFKLKRIENNEQNYKLEKDLLKETYSNNYERINLLITIVLGVIGILGYLGIRDISSIKREYEKELSSLRDIQGQFKLKSDELEKDKKKFEEDLKGIIKENEEQSRKIKFIELKERAGTLLKDGNLASALEFSNAALDISGNDISMLNLKGRVLCRLNQLKDAVDVYLLANKTNPNDNSTILNTAECLYFAKDIEVAKKIIEQHKGLFESKENGRLLELFHLIELYHSAEREKLIQIAKGYVDLSNLKMSGTKMTGWDLGEAKYFIHFEPESEQKKIIQNIIWYLDGSLTGESLLQNLNIPLPQA